MRREIKVLLIVIIIVGIGYITAILGYKTFSYGFLALIINIAVLLTGFVMIKRNDNLLPLNKILWFLVILFTSLIGFLVYLYFCEKNNLKRV